MAHTLTFSALHEYDAGQSGITVPVLLSIGSSQTKVTAKLDTGASCCIFRRGYGEALGMNVESGTPQPVSTANSSFLTYGHEVTLAMLGFQFEAMVYFAADESFTRDVLGRQGWLRQLKIGIVDYDGKLYISKYDDSV